MPDINNEIEETPEVEEPTYTNEFLNANALLTVVELVYELEFSPIIPENFDFEHTIVIQKLSSLINEVSAEVESYIKRPLGKQEYNEFVTLSTNPQIQLTHRPIREVLEINSQYPITVNDVMNYTDKMSLEEGTLQVGRALPMTRTYVGLARYPQHSLLRAMVKYEAGYVLPQDATEDNPSDLPADIKGVVKRTCVQLFNDAYDYNKAQGLIVRQEGNVNRMWSDNTELQILQHGVFSKAEQRVLDAYKAHASVVSV